MSKLTPNNHTTKPNSQPPTMTNPLSEMPQAFTAPQISDEQRMEQLLRDMLRRLSKVDLCGIMVNYYSETLNKTA